MRTRNLGSLSGEELLEILNAISVEELEVFRNIEDIEKLYQELKHADPRDGNSIVPFMSNKQKIPLIEKWVNTRRETTTLSDLEQLLIYVDDVIQYAFLSAWRTTDEGRKFDISHLTDYHGKYSDNFKLLILSHWFTMRTIEDKIVDVSTLDNLVGILFQNRGTFSDRAIINFFLILGRDIDFDSLKQSIKTMDSTPLKGQIVSGWFATKAGSKCSPKQLLEIFSLLSDNNQKTTAASSWFKTENPHVQNLDDLKSFTQLAQNDEDRTIIITSWFMERSEIKPKELKEELKELISLVDDVNKRTLIAARKIADEGVITTNGGFERFCYVLDIQTSPADEESAQINQENLQILGDKVTDPTLKLRIAKSYFSKQVIGNAEDLIRAIDTCIKAKLINEYDAKEILSLCFPEQENGQNPENVVALALHLYPTNELVQIEFFKEVLGHIAEAHWGGRNLEGLFTEEMEEITEVIEKFLDTGKVKEFLGGLQHADNALDLIEFLQDEFNLGKVATIKLFSGRVYGEYESIKNLLQTTPLKQTIDEDQLEILKSEFGDLSDVTVADFFSYHSVLGSIDEFLNLLNPTFLDQIQQTFKLPETQLFLTKERYDNLKTLLNDSVPEKDLTPDIQSTLIERAPKLEEMGTLCKHLKAQIPPIKQYSVEEIANYKICFSSTKSDTTSEVSKKKKMRVDSVSEDNLNKSFIALMNHPSPSNESVGEFVSTLIFGYKTSELNQKNQEKLGNYFRGNKNVLLYLFEQENGLENFLNSIFSLNDGCVANFATQIIQCAEQSLIQDPKARILHAFFNDKIAAEIINQGGDDRLGDRAQGSDKYTNPSIVQSFFSASELCNAMLKYISGAGKKVNDFLEDHYGKSGAKEISQNLMSDELSLLVTYLVLQPLQKEIPDLFNNTILDSKEPELQEILQEAAKYKSMPTASARATSTSHVQVQLEEGCHVLS